MPRSFSGFSKVTKMNYFNEFYHILIYDRMHKCNSSRIRTSRYVCWSYTCKLAWFEPCGQPPGKVLTSSNVNIIFFPFHSFRVCASLIKTERKIKNHFLFLIHPLPPQDLQDFQCTKEAETHGLLQGLHDIGAPCCTPELLSWR